MFRFELKRIVCNRIFIILMTLAFVYFAYLTVSYFRYNNESIKYYKQNAIETNKFCAELMEGYREDTSLMKWMQNMLSEKEAKMTSATEKFYAENEQYAMEHNGEYPPFDDELSEITNDYFRTLAVYNMFDYQLSEYPDTVKITLQKAVTLSSDKSQNIYVIRENQKAIEKYNLKKNFSLIDSKPAEVWHEMYTTYYDYFYIFLAFAFIILAADVFCFENSHSMEGMVFTSKHGRRKLFVSKTLSLFSIAFITMLIFTITDVCMAYYIMGNKLILEPIQTLKVYQMSTANINFLELIIYGSLFRYALLVLVICIASGMSQISRKIFVSAILDVIVLFGMFALLVYASSYVISDPSSSGMEVFDSDKFLLFEKFRGFLPACLTRPYLYFEKFDYINIADYPFLRLTACVIVTVTASVLLALFAFVRFGNVLKFLPHKAKPKEAN